MVPGGDLALRAGPFIAFGEAVCRTDNRCNQDTILKPCHISPHLEVTVIIYPLREYLYFSQNGLFPVDIIERQKFRISMDESLPMNA